RGNCGRALDLQQRHGNYSLIRPVFNDQSSVLFLYPSQSGKKLVCKEVRSRFVTSGCVNKSAFWKREGNFTRHATDLIQRFSPIEQRLIRVTRIVISAAVPLGDRRSFRNGQYEPS